MAQALEQPTFFGRQRELAELAKSFEGIKQNKQQMVLVYGTAGVGKRTLIWRFIEDLRRQEPWVVVFSCQCSSLSCEPFNAFFDITRQVTNFLFKLPDAQLTSLLPKNKEHLPHLFPSFKRLSALNSSKSDLSSFAPEVFNMGLLALKDLLYNIAEKRPLIIVLQELQWIDQDSLKVLQTLFHSQHAPAALLIASLSLSKGDETGRQLVGHMTHHFHLRFSPMKISRLAEEDALNLAAHVLALKGGEQGATKPSAMPASVATPREIIDVTRGHPLYIKAFGHYLKKASHGERIKPQPIEKLLWQRVLDLPPQERLIVEYSALAGTALLCETLAAITKITSTKINASCQTLSHEALLALEYIDSQLFIRPGHALLEEAVRQHIEEKERRKRHLELAQGLTSAKKSPRELIAEHYLAAGDLEHAKILFAEAADHAEAACAYHRASRLYQQALEDWPGTVEKKRELYEKWGGLLAKIGQRSQSAQAFLHALPGTQGLETLRLTQKSGEQLIRAGHIEEGLREIRRVLCSLGIKLPQTPLRAVTSLLLRRLHLRLRGLHFKPLTKAKVKEEQLLKSDICQSTGLAISTIDPILGSYLNVRFVLEALNLGEVRRVLIALATESSFVAANGKIDSSYFQKVMQLAMDLLETNDETLARLLLITSAALGAYMQGRWREVLNLGKQAELLVQGNLDELFWELNLMRWLVFWSLYYLGELKELALRLPAYLKNATKRDDLPSISTVTLGLTNIVWLNAEGPAIAREMVKTISARWTEERYHLHHYYAFLAEAHIDLFEGEVKRAWERVQGAWPSIRRSLLLQIPSVKIEAHYLRARAALAVFNSVEPSARKELLVIAQNDAKALQRLKIPWTSTLARMIQASVDSCSGKTASSMAHLESAIEEFNSKEMSLCAAVARRSLGILHGGEQGQKQIAEAEAIFREQGVKDPEKLSRLFAPEIRT